jgi:hypothetical protein
MLLSLAGGAAGCWVAYGLLRLFVSIAPQGIPLLQRAAIDQRVLLFTLAVTLVSGLLFGLAPVWRQPNPGILTGSDAQPISRSLVRQILVTSQIAVSLVLLTGAGLLLRSLWKIESVPLGMDAQNIVTAEITLPEYRYPQDSQRRAFFDQLQARLGSAVRSHARDELLEYRDCRTAAHLRRNWRSGRNPPGDPFVFFDAGNQIRAGSRIQRRRPYSKSECGHPE